MDYKKKYENALPYIKDLIEHNVISIENAGKYFPELKESEDGKIRKAIVELVLQSAEILGSNNQSRMLAWLEKQGKYETIWKPTIEQINALTHFIRSVGESGYASPYDNNTKLLYSLLTDLQVLQKQGEQKPAWSEEDEDMLDNIIDDYDDADEHNLSDDIGKVMWLKSLKQRMR